MKKKLLSIVIVSIFLISSLITPAFAIGNTAPNVNADGAVVTDYYTGPYTGVGAIQKAGESYGEATITSNNGIIFKTLNDDDNIAKDLDTEGADISVWAKTSFQSDIVYKIDIKWGAMIFEFNKSTSWNTEDHRYSADADSQSWKPSYLNGENNRIDVTNHSNHAVDAIFDFSFVNTMIFSGNPGNTDDVVGNFFADNDKAKQAALVIKNTYASFTLLPNAVSDKLTDNTLTLPTAEVYIGAAAGARSKSAFFAFSGTPEKTINDFSRVGTIVVTVIPNIDVNINA